MTIREMTIAVQRALGITADGLAGPETWGALYRRFVPVSDDVPPHHPAHNSSSSDITVADARSEKMIQTLLPQVRPYARSLLHELKSRGLTFVITSALRGYGEQDALYAQGRTKPGKIVTNARGGHSWHNHGVAFDVTLFQSGKPVWESPLYAVAGTIGNQLGLEWGGSWKSFKDEPHFQLTNGRTLAEARAAHERGETVFG